jgi:uncharacterized protein (DUF1697 family)
MADATNVYISMLRGINVGGNNMVKMKPLCELYQSLGLLNPQSYVQSGNVVFRARDRDESKLSSKIEAGIEQQFGFRPKVIVRTPGEMRAVIEGNPFAAREGIEPSKLLVNFLSADPGPEAWDKIRAIKTDPEEMQPSGRELYIYFPNGMGRSKLPFASIDKILKTAATGRNWNTVLKLNAIAAAMESSAE